MPSDAAQRTPRSSPHCSPHGTNDQQRALLRRSRAGHNWLADTACKPEVAHRSEQCGSGHKKRTRNRMEKATQAKAGRGCARKSQRGQPTGWERSRTALAPVKATRLAAHRRRERSAVRGTCRSRNGRRNRTQPVRNTSRRRHVRRRPPRHGRCKTASGRSRRNGRKRRRDGATAQPLWRQADTLPPKTTMREDAAT